MTRRLIEEAFPLKKVSEDSKHEKNVRHGHISTLHIWPARRPLAACRAAIIAALMPDPGDDKARDDLCRRIGNITHWKSENGPDLQFFRDEIRKAFGGRAPKVLDMFAGGGAIPLEAMRLGCDVTAIDYNPVAWFILKCTLEFPQKLAGKTWPLPTTDGRPQTAEHSQAALLDLDAQEGNLAAHVRYWGNWVLERARQELAPYYPMVDGKPTVAYLWARTVPCQDPKCGATVPLLKTLWLCKKDNKRRALRLKPNAESRRVEFEIWEPENDDAVDQGTMSRAGVQCPCCGAILRMDYIRACGEQGKIGMQMTAVVVGGENGKEYRQPIPNDFDAFEKTQGALARQPANLVINEAFNPSNTRSISIQLYGFHHFADFFNNRQLLAMTTFAGLVERAKLEMNVLAYPPDWIDTITAYLSLAVDKLADYNSSLARWLNGLEAIAGTFGRFALSIMWDYAEACPISDSTGGYMNAVQWVANYVDHALIAAHDSPHPSVDQHSAQTLHAPASYDLIVTDPPYYDAISYADISDFFYVWLKRTAGISYPEPFAGELTPKNEELVQNATKHGSELLAKRAYESGMAEAFGAAFGNLKENGRLVIVFAHKDPFAWETLAEAMITAGFVVVASWPISTERAVRSRALAVASLASSIWLVCRKRPADAGIGRYVEVKKKMQERITERLRYFWDQGISGPDFMWAAVGPALESYSTYREVRRMDGSPFTVSEFLKEVRRLVADFALGRILHGASTEGLDEWTRYYLMHRSNFRLVAAPVGECILLAQGYGLDLNELKGPRGFIAKGKAKKVVDEDEDADSPLPSETEEGASGGGSGSNIRLLSFDERKRDDPSASSGHRLGEPHPSGGLPLIDMLHRLMRLWQAGDTEKLTTYVQQHGLSQNDLFWAVAQAILEMAEPKTKERALLEALVAWGRGTRSAAQAADQPGLL